MPAEMWGRQFRAQNQIAKYPFDDDAELVTTDGMVFASDAIIDASIYIIGTWTTVGLTQIVNDLTQATLWFGNKDHPKVASATLTLASIPASLAVYDTVGRPAGLLVLNQTSMISLQTWPIGTHVFPAGTANLVASTLVPTPEVGVQGIIANSTLFTGNVWFTGDYGVILSYPGFNLIVINIIGEPLFLQASCVASGSFTSPSYLQTINHIRPDIFGGFLLAAAGFERGNTALRFTLAGSDEIDVSIAGPAGK